VQSSASLMLSDAISLAVIFRMAATLSEGTLGGFHG